MKKLVVIIFVFLVLGVIWYIMNQEKSALKSPQLIIESKNPIPTVSPSPTPYPVTGSTNLKQSLGDLTPEDFSQNYADLTK